MTRPTESQLLAQTDLLRVVKLDRKMAKQIQFLHRNDPDWKSILLGLQPEHKDSPNTRTTVYGWIHGKTLKSLGSPACEDYRYWLIQWGASIMYVPAPSSNSIAGQHYSNLPQLFIS